MLLDIFPGKLMKDLSGKPVILRTYEAALQTELFDEVYVVTDSDIIYNTIDEAGGKVMKSQKEHECGSDRLAEASENIHADIIVNVQGDEPLIPPAAIDQLAEALSKSSADMATLASPLNSPDDMINANVVKVVTDARSEALYFSRAAIPFNRDKSQTGFGDSMQHIGLYAYRAHFLHAYQTWNETALEKIEQLEQLRALYYGARIFVSIMQDHHSPGVDTIEDLEKVRELLGCYD